MAQKVITLANEETSQDILARVKNIETKANQMQPMVSEVKGGYPYVKYRMIQGDTGSATVNISGKARVLFLIARGSSTAPDFKTFLTIDGVTIDSAHEISITSDRHIYCENSMTIKFTPVDRFIMYYVVAQFASSSGTLS